MNNDHKVLDTEAIGRLWKDMRSYKRVTDHLRKAGVVNPATGKPYAKSTIVRRVHESKSYKKVQKTLAARAARSRKKMAKL